MKNSQKGFVVPLIIAIIAVLAIGGAVYYYSHSKIEVPTTSSNGTTTTAQGTSTSTDQYAGWKTYTNTTYNYSIKYPSTWFINTTYSNQNFTPRGPAPSIYMGGDTSISNYSDAYMESYQAKYGDLAQPTDYFVMSFGFTKIDPTLSLNDYLNNPSFGKPDTTENIVLNGISGVRHTYLNTTGIGGNTKPNSTGLTLKRGGEIIGIGYGFDNSVASIVPTAEKIVASFTPGASDKQTN